MAATESKEKTFRSLAEFEREFLPNAFEKKMKESSSDARALGTTLARQSLEKVMRRLRGRTKKQF